MHQLQFLVSARSCVDRHNIFMTRIFIAKIRVVCYQYSLLEFLATKNTSGVV